MTEINDVRIANVRKLIEQHDSSPSKLANRLGYKNGAFLVQMAGPNPTRRITEKTARTIEAVLGLPDGWLDHSEGAAPAHASEGAPVASRSGPYDPTLVSSTVQVVVRACNKLGVTLSPEKFGDVVALILGDCVESGRAPNEAHVQRLLNLLK